MKEKRAGIKRCLKDRPFISKRINNKAQETITTHLI